MQILATAVLFSTGGAGIKGNAFTDWQVASFRCLVAAIAMLLLIPESRRGWSWRMLPVSISYAATLLLFSIATKRTTAANAIYLQSIAPAYLVVLSPLILREQIRRSELYLLAGLGLGFSLLVSAPHVKISTAPDPVSGNVLAVL
ncbi:MAG TPA: EamA family transporter, partial [Bryobacteraceae bacterium]|nr:EamA family transporter [Bryobacteraceae bacterium]